ncbi:hypothetical protein TSAR_013737, partial [Trichomalopsis sarcophagae]
QLEDVKCQYNSNEINWIVIELHGILKPYFESINNCDIGHVIFKRKNSVELIIDDHILEGKNITLEKPIIVLRKNYNSDHKSLFYSLERRTRTHVSKHRSRYPEPESNRNMRVAMPTL